MIKKLFYTLVFCFPLLISAEVVLVTGASRGIGLATAQRLAEEGYTVYAGVRDVSITHAWNKNIKLIQLDVTDQVTVDSAVRTILDHEGRLDILVNNAGVGLFGSIESTTIDEAKWIFDVNFFGVMRMIQAVLPIMREQKQGRIIQISSRSGFRPLPTVSVYAASKFALEGLSETIAASYIPWNIYVSLIEAGPVDTGFFSSSYGSRLSFDADPIYSIFKEAGLIDCRSPLIQTCDEIANVVLEAVRAEKPCFRYQTAEYIKKQAALRFTDITGDAFIQEWDQVLFPKGITQSK